MLSDSSGVKALEVFRRFKMVGLKSVATFLVALLPAVSAVPVTDNDLVGKYIVTLKRGLDARDVADHMQFTREVHSRSLVRRGKSVHAWNEGVRHNFKIRDHQSYSAKLDLKTVEEINRDMAKTR